MVKAHDRLHPATQLHEAGRPASATAQTSPTCLRRADTPSRPFVEPWGYRDFRIVAGPVSASPLLLLHLGGSPAAVRAERCGFVNGRVCVGRLESGRGSRCLAPVGVSGRVRVHPKMSLDISLSELAREPKELTDPRALRALAHPLRLALIELLGREGALNATEAAGELGDSQASCSFHLRQLAKFGVVERVPGVGGRARPWRLSPRGVRFANVHADPEAEIAWVALERLLRDRQLGRYRAWLEGRAGYSRAWQEAAYHTQRVAWLTPEELADVAEEVTALLVERFPERREDPALRPADALAVELLSIGYPVGAEEDRAHPR